MTFTGSLIAVNAALDGMTYEPDAITSAQTR